MRIRSTKPEFWRSERIASVSWDARLVLKGLESFVDDNGVGKDDIALIVGDLFQRDLVREPSRTLARVSEAISELAEAGLVWRYDHDGTPLLFVSFWESIQRVDKPQSGRFPRPDGTMDYKASQIRESVANPRESSRNVAPGTGEQGNRGTGEKNSSSTASPSPPRYTDDFESWWKLYPRRVGKGAAAKAYAKIDIDHSRLEDITRRYAESVADTEPRFIPHPATWLNERRFDDDTLAPAPTPEDTIREMWRTGSVGQLRELTGMVPDDIRWPEPEPPDFDADAHRLAQRRSWIETNRDEILRRLKAAM